MEPILTLYFGTGVNQAFIGVTIVVLLRVFDAGVNQASIGLIMIAFLGVIRRVISGLGRSNYFIYIKFISQDN